MDRHDFISRIISMYPHYIKDSGVDTYYDLYKRNLSNKNIDFERLFDIFSVEYKEKSPPTGAYLGDIAKRCFKQEVINTPKWIHVKICNPIYKTVINTDCFPAGTSATAILNTYKKRFPDIEGWQIAGVS